MAWDIKSAISDEIIENPRKLLSEYQFILRDLSPRITIRLYELIGAAGIAFEQSHYIHTPMQAEPYIPSYPLGDYEASALQLAVTSLTQYYNDAVRQGHMPSNEWLSPNEHFRHA
jgi:hypothetical protein